MGKVGVTASVLIQCHMRGIASTEKDTEQASRSGAVGLKKGSKDVSALGRARRDRMTTDLLEEPCVLACLVTLLKQLLDRSLGLLLLLNLRKNRGRPSLARHSFCKSRAEDDAVLSCKSCTYLLESLV